MNDYCSFHNHTTYSIMHSLIKPKDLFIRAKELGQSAIGVTDLGTLGGAWDCLKYSKEAGVKLIMGQEFYFVNDVSSETNRLRHVILIAKNAEGYRNLLYLNKLGNEHGTVMFKRVIPRIDWKMLEQHSAGLICTTACGGGILSQLINTRRIEEAKQQALRLKSIFGDSLALEIQPHNMRRVANLYKDYEDQRFTNGVLISIGDELGIKVIVATDAHYMKPEDHEAHDVMLAIASGQPVSSGNRLKYTQDFFIRSRDEIVERLKVCLVGSRTRAEEFCDNTLFFAAMCEEPDWINPKFYREPNVNWELPVFPVQDQPDYQEFKVWLASSGLTKEDDAYLKYLCDTNFDKYFSNLDIDKRKMYKERVEKELDVFAFKNLSSYMLIVADYVGWAKNNKIPAGPGRGCLTANTLTLTDHGFKNIDKIQIGDKVYSHTGWPKLVTNTFSFDVNEKLLKIKSEFSFNDLELTNDHKIFASKAKISDRYKKYLDNNYESACKIKKYEQLNLNPQWIEAKNLEVGDYIFSTFPNRKTEPMPDIDLAQFANNSSVISDCSVLEFIPLKNNLSIRYLNKKYRLSRNSLSSFKKGLLNNETNHKFISKLEIALKNEFVTLDEWKNSSNNYMKSYNRYIKVDEEFMYFIGRWVGDGWYRLGESNCIGIAFNSNDNNGITRITNYLNSLGFTATHSKHKTKDLIQLYVYGRILPNLMRHLFPDYKLSSGTKHLPVGFRKMPNNLLLSLLLGLRGSDGSIEQLHKSSTFRLNIDSTSLRLILEVKEALLYLKFPSSVSTRKPFKRGKYNCNTSYKLRFRGVELSNESSTLYKNSNGFFARILDIKKIRNNKVYDFTVEDDHSYLTTNGVVHNSVAGSLVAYLLGIHVADPIKYGLIFERFYSKTKEGTSDADLDFSQSGKPLVEEYISSKYGKDNCAKITNYMTLTPKPYAKSISRVFQFGGDPKAAVAVGNAIAESIPKEIKTVKEALESAPLFIEYANSPKYNQLAKYAEHIGNKVSARSTHAAGVIICGKPLHHIVPVRKDKDGVWSVEYEKERAEANGLIKMDILGLSTLDIIDNTFKLIKERGKNPPSANWNYDENDPMAYELISKGDTYGVFQFGTSSGTIDLCKRMQPTCIEDLAAITALTRPGVPKEFRNQFLDAKFSNKKVELLHPCLERSLKGTHGIPVFDECMLTLGEDVAGWDLNESDRLRKFIKDKGKHPDKDKKLKKDFIASTIKNGIEPVMATKLWDELFQNFAAYLFNKSLSLFEKVDIYSPEGKFLDTKTMEEVALGDFVRSRDEFTKQDVYVKVINKHDHGILPIVEIELVTGEKVKCTIDHKFRVKENGEMLPLWKIIKDGLSITVNTVCGDQ